MKLNDKSYGKKSVTLAFGLALVLSLYVAGSAHAESESGGFICVGAGDGSESGGVYSSGAESSSGGIYNSGAESSSGGITNNGAESESGGVFSNGSESETGGARPDSRSESGGMPVDYNPNYGIKYYKW